MIKRCKIKAIHGFHHRTPAWIYFTKKYSALQLVLMKKINKFNKFHFKCLVLFAIFLFMYLKPSSFWLTLNCCDFGHFSLRAQWWWWWWGRLICIGRWFIWSYQTLWATGHWFNWVGDRRCLSNLNDRRWRGCGNFSWDWRRWPRWWFLDSWWWRYHSFALINFRWCWTRYCNICFRCCCWRSRCRGFSFDYFSSWRCCWWINRCVWNENFNLLDLLLDTTLD